MPACPVVSRENTGTGPANRTGRVIFFTCPDLEQKASFMEGYYVVEWVTHDQQSRIKDK
jgi:hypothetical protein